ncbi:basic proline-rich protein-like [Canis lupus familiaris]|uniref:basic proline-rich protein-like n=1 Tax=Canis lupus familiaris TaxID=9615 RepID=UPI0018F64077|nr:basic proline-rich protein-like [Canis lupus familiaris]
MAQGFRMAARKGLRSSRVQKASAPSGAQNGPERVPAGLAWAGGGLRGERPRGNAGSACRGAPPRAPSLPPGREAGARQAAAARTCWRKLERLGSGQPSVKPGPGPAGAEGRGPSWRLPARPEQGSARAAPPRPTRVRELGDRTPLGLRGRDRKGLGGANSRRKGKGACFPGCGTEGVGGRWPGAQGAEGRARGGGALGLGFPEVAQYCKGEQKTEPGDPGEPRGERQGREGREGGRALAPAPTGRPAPGRGAAPARPLPGPSGRAWPGGTRPPHTSRASGALPVPPAAAASRGEGGGAGPARPSNLLRVHSHDSRPGLPAPEPGRPVPAPAPPAWLHKVAEKPPPARPGPARMRGRSGSRAPRAAPPWPCAEPRGWTDGGAGGGAAHALRGPAAARAPSTHLAPAPAAAGGAGSGAPGPPSTPCPRPLSPSSEGQSVRRLSPAALATCPKFRCPAASCARRPLPDPSGCAPLRRPAPSALPAAVGAAAAARWVQPAAAASAVTEPRARRRAPAVNPRPLPAAPGRGQHTPPTVRPAPPRPAPPRPALLRPSGPAAAPAGKCSPSRRLCRERWDL